MKEKERAIIEYLKAQTRLLNAQAAAVEADTKAKSK